MKKVLCMILALSMSCIFFGCKSKAASQVEAQITGLGEITLESGNAIAAAEDALAALSVKQRVSVENVSALTAARLQYDELLVEKQARDLEVMIHDLRPITLKSEPSLIEADTAYNAADINVKTQVENFPLIVTAFQDYLLLKANQVEIKIRAIQRPITLDSAASIEEAQKAYDQADGEIQNLVSNITDLTEAKTALQKLQSAD